MHYNNILEKIKSTQSKIAEIEVLRFKIQSINACEEIVFRQKDRNFIQVSISEVGKSRDFEALQMSLDKIKQLAILKMEERITTLEGDVEDIFNESGES